MEASNSLQKAQPSRWRSGNWSIRTEDLKEKKKEDKEGKKKGKKGWKAREVAGGQEGGIFQN